MFAGAHVAMKTCVTITCEYKDTDGHQLDLQQWYGEVTSKLALLETFLPNQDLAQDSSGNVHGVETGLSSQHPTAADAAVQPTIPSQPGAKRARSFTGTESVDPVVGCPEAHAIYYLHSMQQCAPQHKVA